MENSQKINCHDVTPIREGRVITIVCVKTTVLEKCFEKKTKELVFESISRIKKSISRQDFSRDFVITPFLCPKLSL